MPIQLPYILSQLNVSNLPNAVDSSGDTLGKAVDVQILDANFLKLSQVVNVSSTPPSNTYEGMLWFDTANSIIRMWSGSAWVSRTDISNLTDQIKVTSSAPSNPTTGTIWLDTGSNNTLKMWNGSNWVTVSGSGAGLISHVPNGSFEIDSNNDGIPDGWTRVLYSGGSAGFETTNPAHGARAYRFTHPGGTGNGGGYLESDFIEIDQITRYVVTFIMWSTVTGIKNMVNILYYKKDKTSNGSGTIFTSTSNPTSPTQYAASFAPPADTRYIKIQLIGGFTDTNVAGSTYFDRVGLRHYQELCSTVHRRDDTERSTTSTSFVDTATQFTIHGAYANVPINLTASLRSSNVSATAEMRWRIGSTYSNTSTAISETARVFTITPTTSGTLTLVMQLRTTNASYTVYGVKNTDVICFEPS